MTRTCSDCSAPVSKQAKTGRCRPCSLATTNADPAIKQRQREGSRAHAAKPEVKAALVLRLSTHVRTLSPQERERRSIQGRHIAATVLQTERVRSLSNSAEAKARAGAARTDTVLAWCPPEYRDRYRYLKQTKLLLAAEAKRVVLDEIATVERRRIAALTPLERQLERVRNGAKLITVQPRRSVDPDFTIGGVATGMI